MAQPESECSGASPTTLRPNKSIMSSTKTEEPVTLASRRSSHTPYEFDKSKPVITYNNEKEFLKKFIDENFQDCELIDYEREHLLADRGQTCFDSGML